MLLRFYVEKKPPFAVEASSLLRQLGESFGGKINSVRVLNRYDVENLEPDYLEYAKNCVFSEPMVDQLYEESFPTEPGDFCFAVEYLPGQYNQRADSALQCLQLLNNKVNCLISTAKLYILRGELDDGLLARIKSYLINAVDSREAAISKPATLRVELPPPAPVPVLDGFTSYDKEQLEKFHTSAGLAMSIADLLLIQSHFKAEGREPTETELRVLDTYWSDHCRHTTFSTRLERIEIEDGHFSEPIKHAYGLYLDARGELRKDHDVCLMDMATIGMKQLKAKGLLNDLDESDEINACSIRVDADIDGFSQPWLIQFKNETHNHPTEIEPFGGAATCLGGAIRDPLSGRSYVYQAVRVTGSGDPRAPLSETLPGKLPQKRLTQEAAHGFSSYGNQIGLATGHVREYYHPGFVAKRMEIGAVVGAAPRENVVRSTPVPGDRVLLVGGRTGRDGCGGATGSSKVHTEASLQDCAAEVQKGNPVTERKLQRLFRNSRASRMIKRCNDFGAGGVAVAVGELTDSLEINLDLVPKKYEGLNGTELAISEAQERMAVVLAQNDTEEFMKLCSQENLEATEIAVVTGDGRLRMTWHESYIVDIPRSLLDQNGAPQTANALISTPQTGSPFAPCPECGDTRERWLKALVNINVCSQKGLVERFDSSIGAGTVLMPFGGAYQTTPAECSVCKLPLTRGETNTATIMAHGYDPEVSEWSPFHGAVYAVVESLAKITACGGDYKRTRFSFQEYFERLGDDSRAWGKPSAALLGAYWSQLMTGCAAIGGKDSMSGSFGQLHVPPVLAAFGLCVCDARTVISPEFKQSGSKVVCVPLPRDQYHLPDFDALHTAYSKVHTLIKDGRVLAAHTVACLSYTLAKMCFGNRLGLRLYDDADLFSPNFGSLVLEMPNVSGIPEDWQVIGETTDVPVIHVKNYEISLSELQNAWQTPLEGVFPSVSSNQDERIKTDVPIAHTPAVVGTKPRVFIPVFPGTNCETDSQRAFERAGAQVDSLVFRNLTAQDIDASIDAMRKAIENANILMFAGGFSAGDEPDGSAKFITAVCRNPHIKEAIHQLVHRRGGLILGICNGFQALIKLGLLTDGYIDEPDANAPTLSYNTLGRHISKIAVTRVVSVNSPWLAALKPGQLHSLPISHGEGRFIAPPETIKSLFDGGQVATVYHGFNPNGSMGDIEGLISPCGRILGKMGHSERFGKNTYKNIPGVFDQRIFESGVSSFGV